MTKHIIDRGLQDDYIYNMENTGFYQKSRTQRVISVKVYRYLWEISVEDSFNLIMV